MLGYYHGHLMYFVQVNVVIHVYKRCTLLNSYWRADPPSSMSWDVFRYAMYYYGGLREYMYSACYIGHGRRAC